MGQRSVGDTIAGIYQAFLTRRRWSQADLARALEITSPTLGKRLNELAREGMPVTPTTEHPHVVWSVPSDWFPGGVFLKAPDASEAARLLARGRASKQRDQLISKLTPTAPTTLAESEPDDITYLSVIEDSRRKSKALRMRYFTASRGALELRDVSVAKIFHDPPVRFVAVCHRASKLKWFRADGVIRADLTDDPTFRPTAPADVATFVQGSVDGFRDSDPKECAFSVQPPESRWVARNLPWPLRGSSLPDGRLFVQGNTGGLLRVARFVVSLGGAAHAETPELRKLVRELAQGAVANT